MYKVLVVFSICMHNETFYFINKMFIVSNFAYRFFSMDII